MQPMQTGEPASHRLKLDITDNNVRFFSIEFKDLVVEKVKYKMQPVLFRRDLQIYDCLKFKDTYKDCPQKGLLVV